MNVYIKSLEIIFLVPGFDNKALVSFVSHLITLQFQSLFI